jgi:ornithine cyclodeaminase/alanine dehydrogenase-like protein (mu-crystallin family)
MVADTIILWAELMIERGRHSLLGTESLCCDLGTIKFAKSLIAFCKRFGSLLRGVSVRIPHLNPLPFGKGEANVLNMKTSQLLFLNEDQVRQHLRMADLIPAMEKALIDFSAGKVTQPVRSIIPIDPPGGFLGLMPALTPDGLGLKAVTFYPSNAERGIPTHMATIFLVDPETGTPLATMDGRLITEMRTAAVSAAATRLLASPDAKVLAILGSGVQARSHVEALRLVRQFEEIRVWSPTFEHATQFANEIGAMVTSVEQTVRGADVIVTVTSSKTPVLKGHWLKPGCHVNAIGACRPDWRELDDEAMAYVVFVDSREGAMKESGDVILSGAKIYSELGEAFAGKVPPRANETTIFKSLGMAVEDIAAATLVYQSYLGLSAVS